MSLIFENIFPVGGGGFENLRITQNRLLDQFGQIDKGGVLTGIVKAVGSIKPTVNHIQKGSFLVHQIKITNQSKTVLRGQPFGEGGGGVISRGGNGGAKKTG